MANASHSPTPIPGSAPPARNPPSSPLLPPPPPPTPLQSLHLLLRWSCSHICDPLQSWHLLFWRLWGQNLDPPASPAASSVRAPRAPPLVLRLQPVQQRGAVQRCTPRFRKLLRDRRHLLAGPAGAPCWSATGVAQAWRAPASLSAHISTKRSSWTMLAVFPCLCCGG